MKTLLISVVLLLVHSLLFAQSASPIIRDLAKDLTKIRFIDMDLHFAPDLGSVGKMRTFIKTDSSKNGTVFLSFQTRVLMNPRGFLTVDYLFPRQYEPMAIHDQVLKYGYFTPPGFRQTIEIVGDSILYHTLNDGTRVQWLPQYLDSDSTKPFVTSKLQTVLQNVAYADSAALSFGATESSGNGKYIPHYGDVVYFSNQKQAIRLRVNTSIYVNAVGLLWGQENNEETARLRGSRVVGFFYDGQAYGDTTFHALVVSNEIPSNIPKSIRIEAFPNPFNPSTTIRWSVPNSGFAKLTLHDSSGRELQTLVSHSVTAGSHSTQLNALGLASGIYLVRLQSGDITKTQKITLLK